MALPTQPYKGARDFYPEDKRLQKYMFKVMRSVVEKFGYEEYDAPILEPTDLYLAKGNQEIIEEQTYTFTDRGDRSVTIRTEMTPTVSRLVAGRRQELAYPLRWYSIPNLWRYERPQRGRLREFWQLNVDIFGVQSVAAEHELILVADNLMRAYGATHDMYSIKLSSRKLIDAMFKDYFDMDEVQATTLIRLIDRKNKMEHSEFVTQLDAICSPSQRENGAVEELVKMLSITSIEQLPEKLREHDSVKDLATLMHMLADSGVANAVFDVTLMRGFDYYTDIIFEIFDTHPGNNRSVMGGGRYDGLIGLFGVEPVPTAGWAFGDVPLQGFLEVHDLLPSLHPEADIYVCLMGGVYADAQKVLASLRSMGLKVAVDITDRKLGAQIKTADKKGIHYMLVIGEKELKEEQFNLKNLVTGEEETHSLERIVSIIKDYRKA